MPSLISLGAQDIWTESETQQHQLGALGETGDGRKFRYAKMGEAITMGYMTQSPAIDSATVKMAVTAVAAIGAKKIAFTHAATTSTANEYAEGYVTISFGTGIGQTLKIASHAAFTNGGASELFLEDPLIVALDTTSKISLAHNPWNGVLMDTSVVTCPTGGALRSFTTQYYGWLQTRGVFGAFAHSAGSAGVPVICDATTAGAVDDCTDDLVQWKLGYFIQAGEASYAHPIWLNID
jgi:hypothetical protein